MDRRRLPLSAFIREAALQASAEKVKPPALEPREPREEPPLVLVDPDTEHWVDGVLVDF